MTSPSILEFILADTQILETYTQYIPETDIEVYLNNQKDKGKLYYEILNEIHNEEKDNAYFKEKKYYEDLIEKDIFKLLEKYNIYYTSLFKCILELIKNTETKYNLLSINPKGGKDSSYSKEELLKMCEIIVNETLIPVSIYISSKIGTESRSFNIKHYEGIETDLLTKIKTYIKKNESYISNRTESKNKLKILKKNYYKTFHGKIIGKKNTKISLKTKKNLKDVKKINNHIPYIKCTMDQIYTEFAMACIANNKDIDESKELFHKFMNTTGACIRELKKFQNTYLKIKSIL